jgi:arylsulfatase A-like enzyme
MLLFAALTCHASPAPGDTKRLNVLVLVADDLRPGLIGALGHGKIATPHLDALVRAGTAFRRATCAYPLCVPSRAEILSGRTSFRNGFYSKGSLSLDGPATWAETMRRGGYRTFYVGKWHTSGRPSSRGYDEAPGLFASGMKPEKEQRDHAGRPVTGYVGWMFQTDDGQKFPERGVGLTPDISAEFAKEAIGVLRRKHDKPFFLHVNFTAPHDPRLFPTGFEKRYSAAKITLPKNFRAEHPFDHGNLKGRDEKLLTYPRLESEVRAEMAAYYAVVTHLDEQIGRILAALREAGLDDSTLVLFTSDHGLALGSHGLMGKQNMYEHTINVPLVFRGPGIPANQVRDARCYLRDLYPTVCDLAGVKEVPKELDGKSLASVLRGDAEQIYPFITGYFDVTQRMIRRGRWKFIVYPLARREQLFDLQTDPDELKDLSAHPEHAALKRELRDQMIQWFAEQGDAWAKAQSAKN